MFRLHQCHPFGLRLQFFTLAEIFPGEETQAGSLGLVSKVSGRVKGAAACKNLHLEMTANTFGEIPGI